MPKALDNVPCRKCGAPFRQNSHQQHYCSDACRLSKVCAACGKPYAAGSNRSRFCSPDCRFGVRECFVCNERFRRSKNSRGVYCSQQCYFVSRQQARQRSCQLCGRAFYVRNPKITQTYCGHVCASRANAHAAWKTLPDGSERKERSGYVSIKVNGDWMPKHRYVMEVALGRPLLSHERPHHVNGNRADNRLENLELWTVAHPTGVRVKDLHLEHHCPGCRCFEKRE